MTNEHLERVFHLPMPSGNCKYEEKDRLSHAIKSPIDKLINSSLPGPIETIVTGTSK